MKKLNELGFKKTATNFGATRNLLRALKKRGISVKRDAKPPGIQGLLEPGHQGSFSSSKLINIRKKPYRDVNSTKGRLLAALSQKQSPRAELFHEAGHVMTRKHLSNIKGTLAHERSANRTGIRMIKALSSKGKAADSVKHFKQTVAVPYRVYKESAINSARIPTLRRATARKMISTPGIKNKFKVLSNAIKQSKQPPTQQEVRDVLSSKPELRKKPWDV